MIIISIFLVICMHIRLTRLLENGTSDIKYDSKKRLHGKCISLDLSDNAKLEKAFAMNNENENEVKDSGAKNE